MSTTAHGEFIEVPEPLFKYRGDKVIHPENVTVLQNHSSFHILKSSEVKRLQKQHQQLNKRLKQAGADTLLAAEFRLIKQFNSFRLAYASSKAQFQQRADQQLIDRLQQQRRALKHAKREIEILRDRINPLRDQIAQRNQIASKLQSHYTALQDEKREQALRRDLAKEAELVAEQISESLARMGYKYVYTIKDKTRTRKVQFEYAVVTPDQIQLKLLSNRQGIFGGSKDLFPEGVLGLEITSDKVCKELTGTLEREVWSPHSSGENLPSINGWWYVVERMGNVDGIPTTVGYSQLMARYETADHRKFPIPAGLMRGRKINWVYLDSPSGIHLMFTGISGSGKSNAMRAMVSAIIEKQAPQDIQFVFIDLKKQGDFRDFAAAPHCLKLGDKPVLTEISEVVEILKRIRAEMHARQIKIGHITNNLIDYNKRVEAHDKMPRICIVFDEFANTRRTRFSDDADVIDDICIEIGQVGRAAGISLWIGIQQPRRDNMPSALRDNITTQFVGHQANVGAAQSVTGTRDSLKLEDFPGRMAATIGWKTDKVQMPYIPDEQVLHAVKVARATYGDYKGYQLQSAEDAAALPETGYELVLRTAFEQFKGALKYRPIADYLDGKLSREKVRQLVMRMVEEGVIYEGVSYSAKKKPGNYYALLPESREDTIIRLDLSSAESGIIEAS